MFIMYLIFFIVRPLILTVCSNPSKYDDADVRASASLALAKFMMVSSECCEQNLQVFYILVQLFSVIDLGLNA